MPRRAGSRVVPLALTTLLFSASLGEAARQNAAPTAPAPAPARVARPAAPPTPCETINQIFLRIDALVAEQARHDARTISRVDKVVQQYKAPVTGLGAAAVPCLAGIAMDPIRPEKSRLWALTFLSLIKHYSVFYPVKAVLADSGAPGELRSAAASYLPLLKGLCEDNQGACVTQKVIEAALCSSLEDKALPEPALREVLSRASRYGCDDAGPLEGWIKGFGDHPKGKDWQNAYLAILALTRAKTLPSTRVLLRLFNHYPPGSRGRKLLYKALLDKPGDLIALKESATPMLTWALRAEPGPVGEVMALQALAMVKNPDSASVFERYLWDEDPEVVAEAAAGLAAIGAKQAIPALEKLLDGLAGDPRFAANAKRDRPRDAIGKIRLAVDSLWAQ
ncbi:MAG: HEAT repeat domain-containing protein [Elusimicrobia bacterium]|nr:HEAT repeat domain-containing protein [Elusimicrobiota bacterium]